MDRISFVHDLRHFAPGRGCRNIYADDHKIFKNFKKDNEYTMMTKEVPECFDQISQWMSHHFLQLNPGKTEIIVFGTPAVLNSLIIKGVFLSSGTCIRLSPVAKSLGFLLDSELTFKNQVMKLKSGLLNKLRSIGRMKAYLTPLQVKIIIQAQ